jgi:DNA helicase-2/ATP-dependent DNA helicase PcrA
LKAANIDYVEYLSSTATTRAAAGAISDITSYLSDPSNSLKLTKAYQAWRRAWQEEESMKQLHDTVSGLIRKCSLVENYISPEEGADWLAGLPASIPFAVISELALFKNLVSRWQGTTLLPVDQMILTISQDLFTEPADLALAHKLALVLKQAASDHPDWRLPELTNELNVVARNERRFIGFSADDSGFDPGRYRGKVVISTMHKAKGLEWDRVYLMSVSTYDFPSAMPNDEYMSEPWFARGGLNMEAEALAQLDNILSSGNYAWQPEGQATLKARLDYARERLRLLYVAITRARLELIMTWNSGSRGNQTQALPFAALQGSLEVKNGAEN